MCLLINISVHITIGNTEQVTLVILKVWYLCMYATVFLYNILNFVNRYNVKSPIILKREKWLHRNILGDIDVFNCCDLS